MLLQEHPVYNNSYEPPYVNLQLNNQLRERIDIIKLQYCLHSQLKRTIRRNNV